MPKDYLRSLIGIILGSPVVACAQVPRPFIRMGDALSQGLWTQWAILVSFFWH
jgi:hypothetical protein